MTEPHTPNADAVPPRETSPAPARNGKLVASVDSWQRKLLDLTKRNRALSFRVNKVSTVTVVDEQPAEVFRTLYVREGAMKFLAAPDEDAKTPSPIAAGGVTPPDPSLALDDADEDDEPIPSMEFVPYDPSSLEEKHRDDGLQTSSTADALDKSLRRLDEQARLSIEEQGVNTLFLALGMLYYTESRDSNITLRAPLVLLPVALTRKSARSGYQVRAAEDEPMVNPALAEYLKRDHAITLPELPDLSTLPDNYDLQALLGATATLVAGKPGWSVKNDIYLALLSFQKFVMYKDLEASRDALLEHRLIRQLVTRNAPGGGIGVGLPHDIGSMNLDVDYPPESTFQVVDADSSQLRAIAASARGHDLVVEGPPGTGKSQTITNLIAQALSAGKSVLFVAEKMAALSVVHDRLVQANLGEFCLELHSTKANKRSVMRELGLALDASLQSVAAPTVSTQRLPQVRATLTAYTKAAHTPHGTLGLSPYRVYGELGRVHSAHRMKYNAPVDGTTTQQLSDAVRGVQDLVAAAAVVAPLSENPWRDSTKTFFTEELIEEIADLANRLHAATSGLIATAVAVSDEYQLPPIALISDVDTAATISTVMRRSPGAPAAVLGSDAWNQPPAPATELMARLKDIQQLAARVNKLFLPEVLGHDHAQDIAYVESKLSGFFGFLAILDGRFRSVKRRWLSYRQPTYKPSLLEQAAAMRQVNRLTKDRRALAQSAHLGIELFGTLWNGEESSAPALDNYVQWVVEFRGLCVKHGLQGRALETAQSPAPRMSSVDQMRAAADRVAATLVALRTALGWPSDYLANERLDVIATRAAAISSSRGQAPSWAAFESARRAAADTLAGPFVARALSGEVALDALAPTFLRAFYMKWLEGVVRERPELERFQTVAHDERVKEFQELDQRVLKENRAALVGRLRDRVQNALRAQVPGEQMAYLRKELARQRGISPLRRTMRQAGAAVRAIKPCLMMSPQTVAQLLPGADSSFDLVIFDEASQLPPEDAVGAIHRGKQLIVVGDPKQLPPTNFFATSSGITNAELDEDGLPLVEDSESILEEYMGAGVPMSRLKWHYRSAHESLISFSNVQFYESDLYTFPSVETGSETTGLQFEFVPNGVYEGKGLNSAEARRVVDEVVRFAKEQFERRATGLPTQSLGVGTFNLRQQLAIQDELEQRRRDDPSLEPFFDRGVHEPFFVKNLENIQGDERDVIFISVTYARASDGKLRYNFGPLNGENGWRRLNVLTTRARQRMRVFSSMKADEISAAGTTSRGATLLREFLRFAEHGVLESTSASLAAGTESPFERDVLNELTARSVSVVPQVGVAGYRIDLGVLDDNLPGRFLCGIECDGVAYHSSETARDRDRLRQQVLEARGWTIIRVWSTDWFKDRQGQIERLLRFIADARARASRDQAAEREARLREAAIRAAEESAATERARTEASTLLERGSTLEPYSRPKAAAYQFAPGTGRFDGQDILASPISQVTQAVLEVIKHEGPLHLSDLFTRVAGMWGSRAGSRIQTRVQEACSAAVRSGVVERRGEFYWYQGAECRVRARAGTKISAERIAPEEYRMAVLAILESGHGFSRTQLTTEVRSMFGFSRTGPALDELIGRAIDVLLSQGQIGESSSGIRLRY